MLTKNGGGDHKRRLSRVHYICTMHCVQCTLEKQCTAHHVIIATLLIFQEFIYDVFCFHYSKVLLRIVLWQKASSLIIIHFELTVAFLFDAAIIILVCWEQTLLKQILPELHSTAVFLSRPLKTLCWVTSLTMIMCCTDLKNSCCFVFYLWQDLKTI